MILEKGAPQNIEHRLPKEQRVYAFLDSLGIEYDRVDHEPAMTMEACEEVDKTLGAVMCKNLFLSNRQETMFYLLLIPGDKPFKTKDLSAQLGVARLSFGKAEYMEQYLDITPGSLTVLGLMNDKENEALLLERAAALVEKQGITLDDVSFTLMGLAGIYHQFQHDEMTKRLLDYGLEKCLVAAEFGALVAYESDDR